MVRTGFINNLSLIMETELVVVAAEESLSFGSTSNHCLVCRKSEVKEESLMCLECEERNKSSKCFFWDEIHNSPSDSTLNLSCVNVTDVRTDAQHRKQIILERARYFRFVEFTGGNGLNGSLFG